MKTLTTGEIAKLCDVNLRTVIRWIERGALKGFKLPGRGNNRVREEDFVAFLKEHGMPIPVKFQSIENQLILIVDDEPQVAKAIQRVFKGAGYKTAVAADGFRAGGMLVKETPVLMTLDLSMPGLDGYQILEYVRATEDIANTKILVISALDDDSLNRALDCGADAVLKKPFVNAELLEVAKKLIDR